MKRSLHDHALPTRSHGVPAPRPSHLVFVVDLPISQQPWEDFTSSALNLRNELIVEFNEGVQWMV